MRAVAYEPITRQLGTANGKKNGEGGGGRRGQSYEQFHS